MLFVFGRRRLSNQFRFCTDAWRPGILRKTPTEQHFSTSHFSTREIGFGNTFGHVCLSVLALAPKSLDLETSFLVGRYIVKISRSDLCIKVMAGRPRSKEQIACLCALFAGGLLSTEKQSCLQFKNDCYSYM